MNRIDQVADGSVNVTVNLFDSLIWGVVPVIS